MGGVLMSVFGKKALVETRELEDKKANKKQMDWVDLTLQSGWTGYIKFKYDDLENVYLVGNGTVGSVGTNTLIARVPAYYRPENTLGIMTTRPTGGLTTQSKGVVVSSDGWIRTINVGLELKEGQSFGFSLIYPKEDL